MYKFIKRYPHQLVFFYFILAATYITYPLIFHFNEFVPGYGDELYITWILNWNIHALSTNPLNLFSGNIYFPYQYPLSFSDLHLASSILAFLPVKMFGEPIIAYTLNLFLAFSMLGFSLYLLVYFLTKDYASSISAGTICAFSTYLLPKIGQLQVLTIYWIPLSLVCFFAYIKFKKFKYFFLTILFFYLQFINSFMPAYFLFFVLLSLSFYEIFKNKKPKSLLINKKNLITLSIFFLLSIPIIYPYYHTSHIFNYVRDIRDSIHFANRPEFFFYNFGRSNIGPIIGSVLYKTTGPILYDGYRGFMNIVLTFIVIYYFLFKKRKPKYFNFFTIVSISAYILSMGPALQFGGHVIKHPFIIPLPYSLFYYLAPGFQGFRNSGRIEIYEILTFCIAIGLLLSFMIKSLKTRVIFSIIICIGVLAEFTFPIKYLPIQSSSNVPQVYKYLNSTPKTSVIAEFPIYNWDMFPYSFDENKRLYFSTYNFRRTINGGGGFSPPEWQKDTVFLVENFPNKKSVNLLKKIGVNFIIVHNKEFDLLYNDRFTINGSRIPNSKMVQSRLDKTDGIQLIKKFGSDLVYKIKY